MNLRLVGKVNKQKGAAAVMIALLTIVMEIAARTDLSFMIITSINCEINFF